MQMYEKLLETLAQRGMALPEAWDPETQLVFLSRYWGLCWKNWGSSLWVFMGIYGSWAWIPRFCVIGRRPTAVQPDAKSLAAGGKSCSAHLCRCLQQPRRLPGTLPLVSHVYEARCSIWLGHTGPVFTFHWRISLKPQGLFQRFSLFLSILLHQLHTQMNCNVLQRRPAVCHSLPIGDVSDTVPRDAPRSTVLCEPVVVTLWKSCWTTWFTRWDLTCSESTSIPPKRRIVDHIA